MIQIYFPTLAFRYFAFKVVSSDKIHIMVKEVLDRKEKKRYSLAFGECISHEKREDLECNLQM